MNIYVNAMLDGRGLFYASEAVERKEWGNYVAGSNLEGRYSGIQAIAYVPVVRPEELESHEKKVRGEGFPNYDVQPHGKRFEYFPITYIKPFDEAKNKCLFGYDLYSERVSRVAMEQARDTGQPRASGRVELPIGEKCDATRSGFLIFAPVYQERERRRDTLERRLDLRGFIVGVFRPDELLGIFSRQTNPEIDFEVFDGAETTREHLLHDGDKVLRADVRSYSEEQSSLGRTAQRLLCVLPGDESCSPEYSRIIPLEVGGRGGRIWSLHFSALPGFGLGRQGWLPLSIVLVIGLVSSGVSFELTRRLTAARERLTHINAELEAANEDQKVFASSVPHHLTPPTGIINALAGHLLDRCGESLDERGRYDLQRIQRSCTYRISVFIKNHLRLSGVDRLEWDRGVNLSALARSIAADLRWRDRRREITFNIPKEELNANGDKRLLRWMLELLLGNAWKFTRYEDEAVIEFGSCQDDNSLTTYFVKNNGKGFNPADAERIFKRGVQLDPDNFPGDGTGLAIVRRIVRLHRGKVWARSDGPGRGAIFYFTLGGSPEQSRDR